MLKMYKYFIVVAVLLNLGACASFRGNEIAEVGELPDMSQYENKPSIYLDMKFFMGDPGSSTAVLNPHADKQVLPEIQNLVSTSGLFSEVSTDASKKSEMDYTLTLNFYNHGNKGGAMIMGFISGYTLGIIPAAAKDNYTLHSTLVAANDEVLLEEKNKDSMTTWIGIWFIPMSGNTPVKAATETLHNQVKDILKKYVESGKLEYSLNHMMLNYAMLDGELDTKLN